MFRYKGVNFDKNLLLLQDISQIPIGIHVEVTDEASPYLLTWQEQELLLVSLSIIVKVVPNERT